MKVFAVLLASIFLVSALPTGKKVIINDDGSLTIHDQSLRQITLAKPLGVNGEALVDLVINHPTIPRKSIVLNVEYRQYGSGHKQVAQILNYFLPYNGQYISEETYQHILDQIQADVQNKQISPVLYAACEALIHDELFQQLVRGEGVFAYDTEILGTAVTGDLLNKVHTGIGQPTAKKIILNKDGSLTIYDQALRQITLTRSVSLEAEKWLEIVLNAPGIPVKTIVLNIDAEKYGPRREQLDHLYQILLSFDGKYITEETYLNILVHVRNAVQQWEISPVVYNVLKALDHEELFQQLVLGQGVFVRDAYLVGVPLTGKTINKVYEVEGLHRNQWNHGPYNAVYGVPFTGINQVEDLHRNQWTHGPYNALYGQQYHPRYLEVLNKIYGYGHPLYQHQGEQLYHPEHTLGQRYWYGQGINHHLPQHYGVWGRLNHLQGQVY